MSIYLDPDFIIDARATKAPPTRNLTGYGRQLPTHYMIKLVNNRWYRVYAKSFSNAASFYIRTKHAGERYIDVDIWQIIGAHATGHRLPDPPAQIQLEIALDPIANEPDNGDRFW